MPGRGVSPHTPQQAVPAPAPAPADSGLAHTSAAQSVRRWAVPQHRDPAAAPAVRKKKAAIGPGGLSIPVLRGAPPPQPQPQPQPHPAGASPAHRPAQPMPERQLSGCSSYGSPPAFDRELSAQCSSGSPAAFDRELSNQSNSSTASFDGEPEPRRTKRWVPPVVRVTEWDKFTLLGELGRGATGVVELAECPRGHRYAVKTCTFPDPKTVERELRRRRAGDSPYLVKTLHANVDGRSLRVVMELMDAGSLEQALAAAREQGARVPPGVTAAVVSALVRGLAEMHRKDARAGRQIHRDMKPANTLFTRAGECKIADFGTAKQMAQDRSRQQNTMVGTWAYCAPERVLAQPYGPRADVWSVGVIAAEMALGRCPVTPRGPGPLGFLTAVMDLDAAALGLEEGPLYDFVAAALCRQPDKRPTAQQCVDHPFVAAASEEQHKEALQGWLRGLCGARRA